MSNWSVNERGTVASRQVGIIDCVVFGVPDKNPKSFTWQLHVISGYFSAGSSPTLQDGIIHAEHSLARTVQVINDQFFGDYGASLIPEQVDNKTVEDPKT